MEKAAIWAAALAAIVILAGTIAAYTITFGVLPSQVHSQWGEFGDYFGGVLNPLFAMLAFLAVLWSISIQDREMRASSAHLAQQAAHLATQANAAGQQLRLVKEDRQRDELLQVIKDVDSRLDRLLLTDITGRDSSSRVTIAMMVSEAQRVARIHANATPPLSTFLQMATTPGTVLEVPVREINYLVETMRQFLQRFSVLSAGAASPTIVYYADKTYRLLDLLDMVGGLPEDTREFFATVSDPHG